MKHSFLLFSLFLSLAGITQTQKNVKLHGYVQPVTKGIAGRNEKMATLYNYYMYLSSTSKTRIYPVQIWIKGECLGVKAETVKTPVTKIKDEAIINSGEIVLVPKTTTKVLQLTGTKENSTKNFSKAKSLSENNELVVVYKTGGKFYYATLKQFSELGSAVRQ